MNRRHLLASLAAWPLAAAGLGRAMAAGTPGTAGSRSIAQMQQDWRQFLAKGADIAESTAPLKRTEAEWKSALPEQQFYVLRKFPPPPTANNGGTGFFGPTKVKTTTVNGKVVPVKPAAKPTAAAKPVVARKGKDTNGSPVQPVKVDAPKVGAKPVNPKKGNAAKR